MEKFEAFCTSVCSFIPRATGGEKQAITNELMAHMEDHYDAMITRGVPEDEALERAVREMGDCREIGTALNATLSPFWLWVQRIATFCLVVVLIGSGLPLINSLMNVYENIDVRLADSNDVIRPNDKEIVYVDSDIEFEVNGHIVKILSYGTCINEGYPESYGVHLDMVSYAKNPFAPSNSKLLNHIEVEPDLGTGGGGGYSNNGGATRGDRFAPIPYGTESVKLIFDYYGTHYEYELPLDWGDGR